MESCKYSGDITYNNRKWEYVVLSNGKILILEDVFGSHKPTEFLDGTTQKRGFSIEDVVLEDLIQQKLMFDEALKKALNTPKQ